VWPQFRYGQPTALSLDTSLALTGSQERCKEWWATARR
jgi:hypothetical protein